MATANLTSKGQTTIPKEIREYLQIHPGDRLEFIIQENGDVILVPATVHVRELKGILPRPKKPISLDKIEQVIRKRSAKRCKD